MENPIENVNTIEVIDSNIIHAIKTIRYRNKKKSGENTIVDYLFKSYPNCNMIQKPFLPDSCNTNNKNDNPNINILMSENIKQKRLKILEYFDAYISTSF